MQTLDRRHRSRARSPGQLALAGFRGWFPANSAEAQVLNERFRESHMASAPDDQTHAVPKGEAENREGER